MQRLGKTCEGAASTVLETQSTPSVRFVSIQLVFAKGGFAAFALKSGDCAQIVCTSLGVHPTRLRTTPNTISVDFLANARALGSQQ
jgi:hypothetical protein